MTSDPDALPPAPAPATSAEDGRLLAALALALVEKPRGTLQELAKAIGVSKATLYRFCRTREQLIERLLEHSTRAMYDSMDEVKLEEGEPGEALRRLIQSSLAHRELTAFLIYFWRPDTPHDGEGEVGWEVFLTKMDAFFLRGQRAGAFRIDVSAATLTETFGAVFCGMVDAERQGRVARAGLAAVVESLFLRGASA